MNCKSLQLKPYKFVKSDKIKRIKTEDTNICYTCDKKYSRLYDTYIYDADDNVSCCKLCIFCNIVKSFKRDNIGDCILCWSDMPQYDIIRKTAEHVESKKTIPLPYEIDPDVKIVHINVFLFADFLSQLDKDDRKTFSKFKVFFTNRINRNDINVRNVMLEPYKIEKFSMKYLNIPVYTLSDNEAKLLKEHFKRIEKTNNAIISSAKLSMSTRLSLSELSPCS
jgi:hypothetical protein